MHLTRFLVTHPIDSDHSVMVNTLSGAIDIMENRLIAQLRKNPAGVGLDPTTYKALLERGYLFESRAAEDAELVRLYKQYTAYSRPVMYVICPTYTCNLRCVYCFEGTLTQETPKILSIEEIDAIFKAIGALEQENASIQLFGGEPFLPASRSAVSYILASAVNRGYKISAVTNGVNLIDYIPLLRKYRDYLMNFQITVDGPAAVHDLRRPRAGGRGTFQSIVRSIETALDNGLEIRMRVNVDKQNIDHLVELADFVMAKGWDKAPNFRALLTPVDDHTGRELPNRLSEDKIARKWLRLKRANPQLEIFRSDLFRNLEYVVASLESQKFTVPRFQYCESNNLGCYTFGTDGNIYLCAEAIGDSRTAVGRYFPNFYLDRDSLDRWNDRSILTLKKCRECSVATLCGGGCAYAALSINGSIDEPYCNGAQETLNSYLESISDKLMAAAGP